ncbi:MAG: hypothetical protein IJ538_02900 [Clostridia bacterium]|nr:hypothetical protein [Clostridia bacterium]
MSYDNMKATKQSKQSLDFSNIFDSSNKKHSKKAVKKLSTKMGVSIILIALALVIGLVGGYFGAKFFLKNDTYEMIASSTGTIDVTIGFDEEDGMLTEYVEPGVRCIAFGKDISSECTVTYYFRDDLTKDETLVSGVDENTPGIYYAVYSCPNLKYRNVKLIRNIIVLKEEDDG